MAEKKTKPVNLSALKRERQSKKRALRGKSVRSAFRTEMKKFLNLVKEQTPNLNEKVPYFHSVIDKAYTKGVLTKNAASRKKSRVAVLAVAKKA